MRQLSSRQVGGLTVGTLSVAIMLIPIAFMLPRQMVINGDAPPASPVSPVTGVAPITPSAPPKVVPAAPTGIEFTVDGNVTVKLPVGVVYANQHTDGSWDTITPPENTSAELATAYWWGNGVSAQPGDPSSGTTYIYGHSCSKWDGCAFNKLMLLRNGDNVTVRTANGTLTYQVTQDPVLVPKTQLASNATVYRAQSDRLVLITCSHAGDGTPRGQAPSNWVVQLLLLDSSPSQ